MTSNKEPRWPATLAVAVALILYIALPQRLIIGPRWLIPGLEAALVLPLTILNPYRQQREASHIRAIAVALIALINLANIASVGLLVHFLLAGGSIKGKSLIYSAISIWITNVLVFALWYWELDKGGPARRAQRHERKPDFLFPQMTSPEIASGEWTPGFVDYLYVSLTNATAFSPTDTMPLTPMGKSLMAAESVVSMITVIVVAARAVNILP